MEEDEEDDALGGGVVLDAVDLYCAKFAGRLAVTLSAAVVGSLLGLALSAVRFGGVGGAFTENGTL